MVGPEVRCIDRGNAWTESKMASYATKAKTTAPGKVGDVRKD